MSDSSGSELPLCFYPFICGVTAPLHITSQDGEVENNHSIRLAGYKAAHCCHRWYLQTRSASSIMMVSLLDHRREAFIHGATTLPINLLVETAIYLLMNGTHICKHLFMSRKVLSPNVRSGASSTIDRYDLQLV